jgi:D-alanyl-D-alanine carboxypeptidase
MAGIVRARLGVVMSLLIVAGCGGATPTAPSAAAIASTVPSSAATVVSPSVPVPTQEALALLPAQPTKDLDAPTAARLQAVLDHLITDGSPDALAAVVTRDGRWSGAAGVDGPDGRIATARDEFNIASISKVVVAALILRLAEQGRLDLDAPIKRYLGNLPVDTNGATVRQMLAMQSGIGDTPGAVLADVRANCQHIWSRAETLAGTPAPDGPAGSYEYSNPNYKLLGYAAEQVTGTSLDRSLDDLVFGPTGLKRILQQSPKRMTPKPWALPIAGNQEDFAPSDFGVGSTLPCVGVSTFSFTSAVASDAPSLAEWGWSLFAGDLIDRESLAAMTAAQGPESDAIGHWRLGIELLPDFTDRAFGTRGHQVGYNSFLVILPERQVVAVLFINAGEADVQLAIHQLVAAVS